MKPCWQKVSWTFFWVFDSFFFAEAHGVLLTHGRSPRLELPVVLFIFIFWNFPHRFLFFCSDDEFGSSRTLLVKKMQRLFFFRFSNSIMGSRSRVLWVGGGWDYWVSLFFFTEFICSVRSDHRFPTWKRRNVVSVFIYLFIVTCDAFKISAMKLFLCKKKCQVPCRISLGLTRCYRILPGFTGFHWVLLSYDEFNWIYWVLPGFTGFYWILPSFSRILMGFTWFY